MAIPAGQGKTIDMSGCDCCSPCCLNPIPDTLTATFTSVSLCPTLDGVVVTLFRVDQSDGGPGDESSFSGAGVLECGEDGAVVWHGTLDLGVGCQLRIICCCNDGIDFRIYGLTGGGFGCGSSRFALARTCTDTTLLLTDRYSPTNCCSCGPPSGAFDISITL